MFLRALLLGWLVVIVPACLCFADEAGESAEAEAEKCKSPEPRDTLTGGFFGLADELEKEGIGLKLSVVQTFQHNVRGGLNTDKTDAAWTGSYNLKITLDMDKLMGWKGGKVVTKVKGSWADSIDSRMVGSVFGVNDDAGGCVPIYLSEIYLEQSLFDKEVIIRVGKLDLTGGFDCRGCPVSFDGNTFANDEDTQFLNSALVNNPTIGFPGKGLGLIVHWQPVEWWYASAGVLDGQAESKETGFNTLFNGQPYIFSIVETGVVPHFKNKKGPLPGAYRVGFWYNGAPQVRLDETGMKRGHVGIYTSCDQMLWRENADEDDTQGLGVFCRWGVADAAISEIKSFWSAGAQYQGLIPSRDDDVLGFGVAQGMLSRDGGFSAPHETAFELYYNAQVRPWLYVTPAVQYIMNPGGNSSVPDAVVVGVRVQIAL